MMKKVIFECVGNSILFLLAGMMLIHPFSEYQQNTNGFYVVVGILPIIFMVYLITFIILRFHVFKDCKKSSCDASELDYADEREKIIVAESTKTAYQVLMFSLIVSMAFLAGIRVFSLIILKDMRIDLYSVGISLFTLNLMLAMISYCVKWCIEYKK